MNVSQKIILKNSAGKILALRRSVTDTLRPLTWDLPGGELEEGEDLLDNIRREIAEETGISEVSDIKLHSAVANNNVKGEYWVGLGYTGRVKSPVVTLSFEHDEYRWLSKEKFLKLESSSKIKEFLRQLEAE